MPLNKTGPPSRSMGELIWASLSELITIEAANIWEWKLGHRFQQQKKRRRHRYRANRFIGASLQGPEDALAISEVPADATHDAEERHGSQQQQRTVAAAAVAVAAWFLATRCHMRGVHGEVCAQSARILR